MRIHLMTALFLIGCQGDALDGPDASLTESPSFTSTDHLKEIFDEVDGARIIQTMRELSGVDPVVLNGEPSRLGQRFDDAGRKRFRDYWAQTMRGLASRSTRSTTRPPVIRAPATTSKPCCAARRPIRWW